VSNPVPTLNGTPATGTLNAGTSLTANLPASIVAGELLVLVVGCALTQTISTPAGWSPVAAVSDGFGGSAIATFRRVADGTEGASVTVTLGASCDAVSIAFRLGGADLTAPINVSGTGTNTSGSSTAMTCPSVTTTANNAFIVRAGITREATAIANPGSHTDIAQANTGSTPTNVFGRACYATLASAGATGTAAFVASGGNREWNVVTIAINPVLEAGGTADDRYRFRESVFSSGTSTLGTKRSAWPDDARDFGLRDLYGDFRTRLN
jgi:hypothetical protein